jgi:flagellar hook-length control protein FliK
VVRVVTPLRRLGDGQHDLVLELRPADLGAVRVELSLDKGVVHLGLRAEVEQTGQLLRAALPELRQQLDAAGVMAGRVAVDAGDAGSAGRQWRTTPDDGQGARRRNEVLPDEEEAATTAYSSSAAYGHVDVLL